MNRFHSSILLSLLVAAGMSCGGDSGNSKNCDGEKCDALDLPESEIEASPCDGLMVDNSGRGLSGKIAGRLNDPLSKLVFRAGDDCPTSFTDIMNKLNSAQAVDGFSCDNRRTMMISETAQPLGEATNYRSVTALNCEQPPPEGIVPPGFGSSQAGVMFSAFGLQAGGGLPGNVEIIGFDGSTGVFNFYETDGSKIHFFGNSKDFLAGTGSGGDRRCAACHTAGGLIMKELAAPWLHWEGDTTTPGVSEFISAHEDVLGDQSDGIDMESIVRDGNRDWNKMRVEHFKEIGIAKELLRPLFCSVDFNLENQTSFDNGSAEGIASNASLSGSVFSRRLGFGDISFDSEQYDGVIRANGQVLRGLPAGNIETIFGLTTVVAGEEDENYIEALIEAGVVDSDFVESVMGVDFTRSIFSDDRCGLLESVPDIPQDELNPIGIRAAVLEALGNPSPGTPAAELKNNLANPNDDIRARVRAFADACGARTETTNITFTKDGSSQSLDVPSVLVDYMKIVSLNREQATERPVFEFPQTMPSDNQNVARGTRLHPTDCTITTQFVSLATEFDPGATCFDRCGETAPSGCSCAEDCEANGNCCADFTDQCVIPDCAHGICEEGGSLDARCQDPALPGDCVKQICDADEFCCNDTFDSTCVGAVTSVCGLSCEPDGGGANGECCKTCSPSSQACGDGCIGADLNCAQAEGCACDSEEMGRAP